MTARTRPLIRSLNRGLIHNPATDPLNQQHVVSAWDFDGTNDYSNRGANLTGISDGKEGTLSVWVRVDGGNGTRRTIFGTYNGASFGTFQVELQANNTFLVYAETPPVLSVALNISSTTAYTAGTIWRHLLASWKLDTAGARHLYINDVSDLTVTTFNNATIDYTSGATAIGALPLDGTLKFNGCIAEMWFSPTYIDLSIEANRRKFINADRKPVDLGDSGQNPTGNIPILFTKNFATNLGTGGNFTITGSLDAASTSPSD